MWIFLNITQITIHLKPGKYLFFYFANQHRMWIFVFKYLLFEKSTCKLAQLVFWLHFSVKLIASVLNFCIFTFHFNIKIKSFILKLNFLLLLFIMSASPFTLWQNGEKQKFFVKFCRGSVLKFPDVLWSYGWKMHNQTEQNEIFGQQNVNF